MARPGLRAVIDTATPNLLALNLPGGTESCGQPVFLLLLIPILAASPAPAADPAEIGKTVADFKLHDYQGAARTLADFASSKLVVVAFLGADCPLANRYADRLVEMARQYGPRGVAFLAIDANQQDSLAQLAHLARIHQIEFPLLKDPGNAVADRFGAVAHSRSVRTRWRACDSLPGPG